MPKILSQAGTSLADVYDVEGSIAGIEELSSREVVLVHEMGATIFSERASGRMLRLSTGAIAQSTSFDLTFADVPDFVTRVLGVVVIADSQRVDDAAISIRDPVAGRDMPVWIWTAARDLYESARFEDSGGGVADHNLLYGIGPSINFPSLLFGPSQPEPVSSMVFRGNTTAFGAGTVEVIAKVYVAYSRLKGVSSFGLPVPSW